MTNTFTAVYQPAEEGGFIAFVEEIPGAITQGETIEEARANLQDAIQLLLEANRSSFVVSRIGGVARPDRVPTLGIGPKPVDEPSRRE